MAHHLPIMQEMFPHKTVRPTQKLALDFLEQRGFAILEMATGEGKHAIGATPLRILQMRKQGPVVYAVPNKLLVDQAAELFRQYGDEVRVLYGRSEYECLYYTDHGKPGVTAQESPCYYLACAHRVDQESGKTVEESATPCPYFQAKYDAKEDSKRGVIIVCTHAFLLKNRLQVGSWRELEPMLIVLDEAHRIAKTARSIFAYEITDYHLVRTAKMVKPLDRKQARLLLEFVRAFRRIARKRPAAKPALFKDEEIQALLKKLEEIDTDQLERKVREAVRSGSIDPIADKELLKTLENVVRNIPRMVRSLEYAIETGERKPLNYVVAFYYREDDSDFTESEKKARYRLTIKSYYVAPLIKTALGKKVLAYSATIGDPEIFKRETGLNLPFKSFPSSFPIKHTRIFVPSDVPNLSAKARNRNDLNRTLRQIVSAAGRFAKAGQRSLVVVVSEEERQKFKGFADEANLKVTTYGDGIKAREASAAFIDGEGDVLLGTAGQYAEGVDLPKGIAPVIFFLRPGYPRPDDPEAQFEKRRFGDRGCFALWNWRVAIEALQVRGRNIRSAKDLGVCFFMSQQFRSFLYGRMPEWLRPAYKAGLTLDQAVKESLELLK